MKNILYIVLFLFSLHANAQIAKGVMPVGGGFGLERNSETLRFGKSFDWTYKVNVHGAYVLRDNLALGLAVSFSQSRESISNRYRYVDPGDMLLNPETATVDVRHLAVGPFIRAYKKVGEDLFVYGQVNVYGTTSASELKSYEHDGFGVSALPGLSYFMAQRWSLDVMLKGIVLEKRYYSSRSNETTFNIGLNSLTPSIGLRYYFKKENH